MWCALNLIAKMKWPISFIWVLLIFLATTVSTAPSPLALEDDSIKESGSPLTAGNTQSLSKTTFAERLAQLSGNQRLDNNEKQQNVKLDWDDSFRQVLLGLQRDNKVSSNPKFGQETQELIKSSSTQNQRLRDNLNSNRWTLNSYNQSQNTFYSNPTNNYLTQTSSKPLSSKEAAKRLVDLIRGENGQIKGDSLKVQTSSIVSKTDGFGSLRLSDYNKSPQQNNLYGSYSQLWRASPTIQTLKTDSNGPGTYKNDYSNGLYSKPSLLLSEPSTLTQIQNAKYNQLVSSASTSDSQLWRFKQSPGFSDKQVLTASDINNEIYLKEKEKEIMRLLSGTIKQSNENSKTASPTILETQPNSRAYIIKDQDTAAQSYSQADSYDKIAVSNSKSNVPTKTTATNIDTYTAEQETAAKSKSIEINKNFVDNTRFGDKIIAGVSRQTGNYQTQVNAQEAAESREAIKTRYIVNDNTRYDDKIIAGVNRQTGSVQTQVKAQEAEESREAIKARYIVNDSTRYGDKIVADAEVNEQEVTESREEIKTRYTANDNTRYDGEIIAGASRQTGRVQKQVNAQEVLASREAIHTSNIVNENARYDEKIIRDNNKQTQNVQTQVNVQKAAASREARKTSNISNGNSIRTDTSVQTNIVETQGNVQEAVASREAIETRNIDADNSYYDSKDRIRQSRPVYNKQIYNNRYQRKRPRTFQSEKSDATERYDYAENSEYDEKIIADTDRPTNIIETLVNEQEEAVNRQAIETGNFDEGNYNYQAWDTINQRRVSNNRHRERPSVIYSQNYRESDDYYGYDYDYLTKSQGTTYDRIYDVKRYYNAPIETSITEKDYRDQVIKKDKTAATSQTIDINNNWVDNLNSEKQIITDQNIQEATVKQRPVIDQEVSDGETVQTSNFIRENIIKEAYRQTNIDKTQINDQDTTLSGQAIETRNIDRDNSNYDSGVIIKQSRPIYNQKVDRRPSIVYGQSDQSKRYDYVENVKTTRSDEMVATQSNYHNPISTSTFSRGRNYNENSSEERNAAAIRRIVDTSSGRVGDLEYDLPIITNTQIDETQVTDKETLTDTHIVETNKFNSDKVREEEEAIADSQIIENRNIVDTNSRYDKNIITDPNSQTNILETQVNEQEVIASKQAIETSNIDIDNSNYDSGDTLERNRLINNKPVYNNRYQGKQPSTFPSKSYQESDASERNKYVKNIKPITMDDITAVKEYYEALIAKPITTETDLKKKVIEQQNIQAMSQTADRSNFKEESVYDANKPTTIAQTQVNEKAAIEARQKEENRVKIVEKQITDQETITETQIVEANKSSNEAKQVNQQEIAVTKQTSGASQIDVDNSNNDSEIIIKQNRQNNRVYNNRFQKNNPRIAQNENYREFNAAESSNYRTNSRFTTSDKTLTRLSNLDHVRHNNYNNERAYNNQFQMNRPRIFHNENDREFNTAESSYYGTNSRFTTSDKIVTSQSNLDQVRPNYYNERVYNSRFQVNRPRIFQNENERESSYYETKSRFTKSDETVTSQSNFDQVRPNYERQQGKRPRVVKSQNRQYVDGAQSYEKYAANSQANAPVNNFYRKEQGIVRNLPRVANTRNIAANKGSNDVRIIEGNTRDFFPPNLEHRPERISGAFAGFEDSNRPLNNNLYRYKIIDGFKRFEPISNLSYDQRQIRTAPYYRHQRYLANEETWGTANGMGQVSARRNYNPRIENGRTVFPGARAQYYNNCGYY